MSLDHLGCLIVETDGHVATITINRPEKLNAIAAGFYGDLRAALERLAGDGQTRVVLITGAGERAFSAGGDIAGFAELQTLEAIRAYQIDAMAAFGAVETSPLFVIAAVNGIAFGGGCELTLACDTVVAADTAIFSLPEAALGLVPGFGAVRLHDVVGRQMAKLLIASGDRISAQRAFELGMVQIIAPKAELMATARALAARIAASSPGALAATKRMINRRVNQADFDYSVDELTALQASEDRTRGIEAFLSRRGGKAE